MASQSAGPLGVFFDKVSFVNKVPIVMKATSDDEVPIPGYLYQEVNNMTFDSGGYCHSLLDFLVERLDKNSYHVKLKVLRLMSFIVQNGHPDFRQGLRKQSKGITLATKYSGPPDPLHGNTPYAMVRKAAQDLSQILFSVSSDDSNVPVQPTASGKNQGMGGQSSSGSSRMQGFGNSPITTSKTLSESIVSGIKNLADKLSDEPEEGTRYVPDRIGQYKPIEVNLPVEMSAEPSLPESKHDQHATPMGGRNVKAHKPGVAGGGWDDDEDKETIQRMGINSTQDAGNSQRSEVSNQSSSSAESKSVTEDFQAEQSLVQSFLEENENIIPSRSEINSFLKSCTCLNCEHILTVIAEKLGTDSEIYIMRLLLLVEAITRSDLLPVETQISQLLNPLRDIFTTTKLPQIKAKCRKIIRILEKLNGVSREQMISLDENVTLSETPVPEFLQQNNGHASKDDLMLLEVTRQDTGVLLIENDDTKQNKHHDTIHGTDAEDDFEKQDYKNRDYHENNLGDIKKDETATTTHELENENHKEML